MMRWLQTGFTSDGSVQRLERALSEYQQATFDYGGAAVLALLLGRNAGIGEPYTGPLNDEARDWAERMLYAIEDRSGRVLASGRRQNDA